MVSFIHQIKKKSVVFCQTYIYAYINLYLNNSMKYRKELKKKFAYLSSHDINIYLSVILRTIFFTHLTAISLSVKIVHSVW